MCLEATHFWTRNSAARLLLLMTLAATIPSSDAFFGPRHFQSAGNMNSQSARLASSRIYPMSGFSLRQMGFLDKGVGGVGATMVMASESSSDAFGLEDAFTDSINYTDGPVRTILIAGVVFVAALVALKALSSRVDAAIAEVLVDFEKTMKLYYPSRWERLEETQLQNLTGDERDLKLLEVMEQIQVNEPTFMLEVKEKMPSK
jgi:hypothetical protein